MHNNKGLLSVLESGYPLHCILGAQLACNCPLHKGVDEGGEVEQ